MRSPEGRRKAEVAVRKTTDVAVFRRAEQSPVVRTGKEREIRRAAAVRVEKRGHLTSASVIIVEASRHELIEQRRDLPQGRRARCSGSSMN
jgi:hypothetical protein